MKPGLLIGALSGLALALLTGIVLSARSPSSAPVQVGNAPRGAATVTPMTSRAVQEPVQPALVTSFRWSSLESTNYQEYIANLRRIGCPEDTIRDIIVADISKLYGPREAPFKSKLTAQDTTEGLSSTVRRAARHAEFEVWKQLREIQKEKNALLKQLLNVTLPLEPLRASGVRNYALFEAAFATLPPEKRETVREIQENYWLAADALSDKYDGKRTTNYLAEAKRLTLDRNTQLTGVLSPAEIEEFEMRTSNAGVALRESLAGFNPSEEEYRAIWQTRNESNESNSERVRPPSAAEGNQTKASIKAALGEQRFAEYERSQDPSYRSLTQLAERYGLPPEAALKGYEAETTFRQQQLSVREDGALTPEQRKEALSKLRAQWNRSMTSVFGEAATRAFQRYGIYDLDADEAAE
jgi:hypothetical protein